jgi:transposase InsO family protein
MDRQFARILAVRDLASGYQLLWLPVQDESTATVAAALEALFREHGAPLVLKSDNGSAFIAEDLQRLLIGWQVWTLFSPARMPRYNGSAEAGIGSMKTRTHHQASRRGCPGQWSCDDAEAARCQANETGKPWGWSEPTPEEAWRSRLPLTEAERTEFALAVQGMQQVVWSEESQSPEASLNRNTRARLGRIALVRVLVARGLLQFRVGRRLPGSSRSQGTL